MLFTTLGFLLFFCLVYLLHWSLSGRARTISLLVTSIGFYAVWSIPFALHFLAMVSISFAAIRGMQNVELPSRRNLLAALAILANLANLLVFKYFYLGIVSLHHIFPGGQISVGAFNRWLENTAGFAEITLPLAISFYTFQLIAFLIDVNRGRVEEKVTALKFFTFIMFFPQLVAGPILRYQDFYPFIDRPQAESEKIRRGIYLVLQGLIKKVVVADNMVGPIQAVFQAPEDYSGLSCWIAAAGFSVRVFCDFSGYTDMARGLGLMLGYEFPENFHAPFLRSSLRELWQGWHMTLTMWMRDYIYISLGGNRRGVVREYFNLILTFTLVGAWHGANYTYILWGFMHGVGLSIERWLGSRLASRKTSADMLQADDAPRTNRSGFWSQPAAGLFKTVRAVFVFAIFVYGAVYFNSASVGVAHRFMWQMTSLAEGKTMPALAAIVGLSAVGFFFNALQLRRRAPDWSPRWQYAGLLALGFLAIVLLGRFAPGSHDYIYFQF
ncbi:MAG: MBOAT family protein [Leptospirales bacterium]|nr:MBOAT family protein [Leptospirales bacterium]